MRFNIFSVKDYSAWLTILITCTAVAIFVNWRFIESPPLVVTGGKTFTPEVQAGSQLHVQFIGHKKRDNCQVRSKYFIEDFNSAVFSFAGAADFNRSIGKPVAIRYKITVPSFLSPGPAEFYEVIHYRCNPFKEHQVTTPRIKFTITPPDDDSKPATGGSWLEQQSPPSPGDK